MAKKIDIPQAVKDFLKTREVVKLLQQDDLESIYKLMNEGVSWKDTYLNPSYHSIVWQIFALAGINLADNFEVLPSLFKSANSITKLDTTGSKAEKIGNEFAADSTVSEVIIGDNIEEIGDSAFRGCKNLKSVIIGDNVVRIGKHAFADCPKLTQIYLPESVRILDLDALKANDNCYIFSPPRKPGSLKVVGDMSWLKTHLGVDPRFREEAETPVESEE